MQYEIYSVTMMEFLVSNDSIVNYLYTCMSTEESGDQTRFVSDRNSLCIDRGQPHAIELYVKSYSLISFICLSCNLGIFQPVEC